MLTCMLGSVWHHSNFLITVLYQEKVRGEPGRWLESILAGSENLFSRMSALWTLRVVSYLQSYKWLIINKIDISKGQWPPFISNDFLLLIFIAVYLHLPLRACWDVSTSLPLLELLISCIYHIQSVFFLSSRAAICFPFNRTGHGRLWNRENFLFGMQSLTRFFAKRFDLFLLWDETRLKLDATRTRHWALQSSFGGVVWIMVWYCFSGVVHSFQTNDGRRIPIFASRGTGTSFYRTAIWILSAGDAFNLEVPRLIIFIKIVPFNVSTPTTKLVSFANLFTGSPSHERVRCEYLCGVLKN